MTVTYGKHCNGVFLGGEHCVHIREFVRGWFKKQQVRRRPQVFCCFASSIKPLDRFWSSRPSYCVQINQGLAINQKSAPTFNLIILCTELTLQLPWGRKSFWRTEISHMQAHMVPCIDSGGKSVKDEWTELKALLNLPKYNNTCKGMSKTLLNYVCLEVNHGKLTIKYY